MSSLFWQVSFGSRVICSHVSINNVVSWKHTYIISYCNFEMFKVFITCNVPLLGIITEKSWLPRGLKGMAGLRCTVLIAQLSLNFHAWTHIHIDQYLSGNSPCLFRVNYTNEINKSITLHPTGDPTPVLAGRIMPRVIAHLSHVTAVPRCQILGGKTAFIHLCHGTAGHTRQ